jgi:hypothetical protein
MKFCKYRLGRRCFRSCCSVFDCSTGDVGVCPLHGDPSGLLTPRLRKPVLVSIFSKHHARRAGGVG